VASILSPQASVSSTHLLSKTFFHLSDKSKGPRDPSIPHISGAPAACQALGQVPWPFIIHGYWHGRGTAESCRTRTRCHSAQAVRVGGGKEESRRARCRCRGTPATGQGNPRETGAVAAVPSTMGYLPVADYHPQASANSCCLLRYP
jgi:hypothetical protein